MTSTHQILNGQAMNEVALKILKATSKHNQASLESDNDAIPLASISKKSETCKKENKRQEVLNAAKEVLELVISCLPPTPPADKEQNILPVSNENQVNNVRNRKRYENEWIQNKAKVLRNSGKKYKSTKVALNGKHEK